MFAVPMRLQNYAMPVELPPRRLALLARPAACAAGLALRGACAPARWRGGAGPGARAPSCWARSSAVFAADGFNGVLIALTAAAAAWWRAPAARRPAGGPRARDRRAAGQAAWPSRSSARRLQHGARAGHDRAGGAAVAGRRRGAPAGQRPAPARGLAFVLAARSRFWCRTRRAGPAAPRASLEASDLRIGCADQVRPPSSSATGCARSNGWWTTSVAGALGCPCC
jgi:hypothetical protein